ncbi:MAG TPA: DNA-processing protein DprA [Bryobacteraceae bacterium]|jgi:DNA processing protein|nr:DNA-processing protein DprA [Bryobacteraceae bacterium]
MPSLTTSNTTSNKPALSPEEELYWIALRMVPGLGTRRIGLLLERLQTPQVIFRASPQELEAAGLNSAVARSISSGCSFEEAASQQQKMRDAGAHLITLGDARYPEMLRGIFDPPPVLFARGRVELLSSVSIGVVGTRHPTPYGMAAAERLAGDLARAGLTITSGMARGIDTASHRAALSAALDAAANTIAVLGCGADVVYPSENKKLAAEIAARGLIVSEFPMGATAFPQNFPIRNRVISGLSYGILVVEGAQYSGSAITARLAMDQGREVFSVPGNITSKMSWGPNLLIKQGAKLVQDWNDVVVDLPQAAQRRLIDAGRQRIMDQGLAGSATAASGGGAESSANQAASDLAGPHRQVARMVMGKLKPDQAIHLDALMEALIESGGEASPSEIIAALFELEILGLAKQLPGRNFVKVW